MYCRNDVLLYKSNKNEYEYKELWKIALYHRAFYNELICFLNPDRLLIGIMEFIFIVSMYFIHDIIIRLISCSLDIKIDTKILIITHQTS